MIKENTKAPNFKLPSTNTGNLELNKIKKEFENNQNYLDAIEGKTNIVLPWKIKKNQMQNY